MADERNQNPNIGSEQENKADQQKNPNEHAGQRSDQDQPGKSPAGQSGGRDRASSPEGDSDMEGERQPMPGQPNQQNIDR